MDIEAAKFKRWIFIKSSNQIFNSTAKLKKYIFEILLEYYHKEFYIVHKSAYVELHTVLVCCQSEINLQLFALDRELGNKKHCLINLVLNDGTIN